MCEGIIKAIFENPKADQNPLFHRYVIFQPPRLYFNPIIFVATTFLVANGYNG